MNSIDAIKNTMTTSAMVLKSYVSDLEDAELMIRPGEGCNHVAYQLGHLIASECMLLDMLVPGAAMKLPEGFVEAHGKENCSSDDASQFCTKAEYLELYEKVQAVTVAELEKLSETDLDAEAPERFREMFPSAGHVWILIATHSMMHAGQFVPVRRSLGKPILM